MVFPSVSLQNRAPLFTLSSLNSKLQTPLRNCSLSPEKKMDRYQKVEKPKAETPINENELRITAQGRMRNYISYAMTLLQEKGANEIVLKATGRAINKTVMIAELIKRRIAGFHQNTSTGSIDITDTWEPLEEGLLPYQPPIPTDQVKASAEIEGNEGEDSADTQGKGHGGQGKYGGNINGGMVDNRNGGWDGGRGYGGRARGRGRGRGFRGRGRGYGGGNMQRDSGYYNGNDPSGPLPGQGRGKSLLPMLLLLETTRHVSIITITLSKKVLDSSSIQIFGSKAFSWNGMAIILGHGD
ncbi:hypothetical protein GOBAR_AA30948 [Gossypium barbadense]|uniref:DNA/RNA-binding protein Alba-like domain-containing protein n=1 Tax=Gossypium barbadense TaxID=3634 RepID=A0A2P5WF54_GOSBA|nr:hypothetical protein GOBAR_AA30948 [Gossypium barbadense]